MGPASFSYLTVFTLIFSAAAALHSEASRANDRAGIFMAGRVPASLGISREESDGRPTSGIQNMVISNNSAEPQSYSLYLEGVKKVIFLKQGQSEVFRPTSRNIELASP